MKREQREPWLAKADTPGGLCVFCKYLDSYEEFSGGLDGQWERGSRCAHQLESVSERQEMVLLCGCDCWGFRPSKAAMEGQHE